MTADAITAGPPAPPAPPRAGKGRIRRNLSLLVTPVIIAVIVAGVAAYLTLGDLDPVEARALDLGNLSARLREHILLTLYSTAIVIVAAVPIGIALSRDMFGPIRTGLLAFGGFMQALPPLGVIVLVAFTPLGFGWRSAIVALVLSSLLPVLTNTVVGLRQVDPALIEAARGMGMSAWRTLLRVELPLAVPVMVAGIRVALVLNVGTAALATFIGGLGLGTPILSMLNLGRPEAAFAGAAIVAALALLVDWLAGIAQLLVSGTT